MVGFFSRKGGKRLLAKRLAGIIDAVPHTCYCEPFMGAAQAFFARNRERTISEVLNDIDGELVNLFRVLQHHKEAFLQGLEWGVYAREVFENLQKQDPQTLTDIQRAQRFYCLHKMSFAHQAKNFGYSKKATPRNLQPLKILEQAHAALQRVHLECLPWQDVITRYDSKETLFYLDLALPRARKRLWQGFLLSETLKVSQRLKGKASFS